MAPLTAKGVRHLPGKEGQRELYVQKQQYTGEVHTIMNADDKWVDKNDPTTQELEGVSWNNCEEHLNMKN